MNFISAFTEGQKGSNMGLPMGKGLEPISRVLNGVQRKRIYTIAASPKGGKTTFVDVAFVIEPVLYVVDLNLILKTKIEQIQTEKAEELQRETNLLLIDPNTNTPITKELSTLKAQIVDLEIIYHSYEIDRVSKEFDFMAHFLYRDYDIREITLPEGVLVEGKSTIDLSPDFLMGQLKDDNDKLITVPLDIVDKMKIIYYERIIMLFGEYNRQGEQISKGVITFIEKKENPTGIRNYLLHRAEKNGYFLYERFKDAQGVEHKKIDRYVRNNPNEFVLVITDHVRKLVKERGFKEKENIDKFSEYAVELRNHCWYSFVNIIHLNRAIGSVNRMQYADDRLYPMNDDIKETGNLSEDSNYVLTMFNPNDDKYNLNKHFGLKIRDPQGKLIYPLMRTIHLVDSRHCPFPQHFRVELNGAIKHFRQLKP